MAHTNGAVAATGEIKAGTSTMSTQQASEGASLKKANFLLNTLTSLLEFIVLGLVFIWAIWSAYKIRLYAIETYGRSATGDDREALGLRRAFSGGIRNHAKGLHVSFWSSHTPSCAGPPPRLRAALNRAAIGLMWAAVSRKRLSAPETRWLACSSPLLRTSASFTPAAGSSTSLTLGRCRKTPD